MESRKGGNKKFIRSHGGTYKISGNKYVENITIASWEDFGKEKTDFTFKVQGNTFHQKGTLVLKDGTKYDIDEQWQRVNLPPQKTPGIGTWNQLSSSGVNADGKKWSHTNATHSRYMIITPTHYMLIRHKGKEFESALAGTYKMQGGKFVPDFALSSIPQQKGRKAEAALRVEESKLYWDGVLTDSAGRHTWQDVFEKVDTKTIKTASNR
jgi:hypothetical protein